MTAWVGNPFTGLLAGFGELPTRAHDPAVRLAAGTLPRWGPRDGVVAVGGAGWSAQAAQAACLGEAIERLQAYPLPEDSTITASFGAWPSNEQAVAPESFVLFHPEQYARTGFPFLPFNRRTACRWTCFRNAATGEAVWVPEELAFLDNRAGQPHRLCPSISTGLSCGRWNDPVLLRGLQEVIERDAIMGAWFGSYPLEEWPQARVLAGLGDVGERILRPNLRYRFYRAATPLSAHATIVTLCAQERDRMVFSAGAACRETRAESWKKSILEAVQGSHYARYLLAKEPQRKTSPRPATSEDHALYYSLHPERLRGTVLDHAAPPRAGADEAGAEGLSQLAARLGSKRALFRNMTPPSAAQELPGFYVLKVVVPGLQPLHINDAYPHLGGPLWAPRGVREWTGLEPHPFA